MLLIFGLRRVFTLLLRVAVGGPILDGVKA